MFFRPRKRGLPNQTPNTINFIHTPTRGIPHRAIACSRDRSSLSCQPARVRGASLEHVAAVLQSSTLARR